jgi:hypothetical protein
MIHMAIAETTHQLDTVQAEDKVVSSEQARPTTKGSSPRPVWDASRGRYVRSDAEPIWANLFHRLLGGRSK